jgi:exosortase/archaeosortase family protein
MDDATPTDTPDGENRPPREKESFLARWRPAVFVTVFMSIVLALLMGYRYGIDTPYNDWYLFQVAKHTVAVLQHIGDHAELEHGSEKLGDAKTIRARLAAWARGEDAETTEDFLAAAPGPLTPWEAWSYRAQDMRRKDAPGEHGPRVQFIMRRGLAVKVRELEEEVAMLEQSGSVTADELKLRKDELRQMRRELTEARTNPEVEDTDPTYLFYFIVVSECGAIEVMAIFLAAVVAFPTRWYKKLIGLFAGIPIMYGLNIFRLSCLAVIGAYDTQHRYFNFAHEYVWQAVYIIFVVAVWMFWVEYIVRGRWRKERGEAVNTSPTEEVTDDGQS